MLSDSDDECVPENPVSKKSLVCDSSSSDEDFDLIVPPTSKHFSSSSNTAQVRIEIENTSNGTVANSTPANRGAQHSAATSNKPRWKRAQERMITLSWNGSVPPSDDNLLKIIKDQSNFFAIQKNLSKPLCLTEAELEQYLGMCMYISVYRLPRSRVY